MTVGVVWLLLSLGPAGAFPDPLASLDVGADVRVVEQALGARGVRRPVRLEGTAPQALARGLVDSGLLEAINGAGCTPRDGAGALRAEPFARFVLGARGGARYAASFSDRGLSFFLARLSVPVDPRRDPPGGWSPHRLHRLRRALAALSPYRLFPEKPDRYGNVTRWKGRTPRGDVRIRYRPASDELWVLLAPRPPAK